MNREMQCCTIDQAKILKSLGVVQESLFCWHPNFVIPVPSESVITATGHKYKKVKVYKDKAAAAAFTVSELGAMFGKGTNAASLLYDAVQDQMNRSHSFTIVLSPQFLANCLIGLLETGRVTADEVNHLLLNA